MRSIALLLLLATLAGCGKSSTTAPASGGASLQLQVAPSIAGPAAPATVTATASNDGPSRVRDDGCSFVNGMAAEFRDASDTRVYLSNPLIQPLCPVTAAPFERGRKLEAKWTFDGTLYDAAGQQMQAASGDYTVIVRFTTYSNDQHADPQTLEQQATIHWVVP